MNFDWSQILSPLFSYLGQIPWVGHALQIFIAVVMGLSGTVTGFIALWHAAWALIAGLAKIPGLELLQGLADRMKADEDKIAGFSNSKLLPILNRLSVIPLPKKPDA